MLVIPAIDIRGGRCSRLVEGDYEREVVFGGDPSEFAKRWCEAGAELIHVVDLDGAKDGNRPNAEAVKQVIEVASSINVPVQVGGGIRTLSDASEVIGMGSHRVIFGTTLVNNPETVAKAVARFGTDRVAVSIDARDGEVLQQGWLSGSGKSAIDLAQLAVRDLGVRTVIYTDTSRDGTLAGPNLARVREVVAALRDSGAEVISAGGVSNLNDLAHLKEIGVFGAITGMAVYTGDLDLAEAIQSHRTLTKRVIPCLDVDAGRVVKGVSFVDIADAGDPAELARLYDAEGADELVFLDITASSDARDTMVDVVERVSAEVFIPLTVGGGIRSVEDMRRMLEAGAEKVSLNSAAVANPELISECSAEFGAQCVVLAIDAKRVAQDNGNPSWQVYTHGGRSPADLDAVEWAAMGAELGAGEILITSMDNDGQQDGYDNCLLSRIADVVSIPVIASGGAGELRHFADAIKFGKADAVLAASVFHYGTFRIADVKSHMQEAGIPVRITT